MEAMTGLAIVATAYSAHWVYSKWKIGRGINRMNALRQRTATEYLSKISGTDIKSVSATLAKSAGVVLKPGESVIFHCPALMRRVKKIGSQFQGGSRGVRVSPMKGVSFTVGNSRGHAVALNETQFDSGSVTLTSDRVIFTGDEIKFAFSHDRLENVSRSDEFLEFDVTHRDVPDFRLDLLDSRISQVFVDALQTPDEMVTI